MNVSLYYETSIALPERMLKTGTGETPFYIGEYSNLLAQRACLFHLSCDVAWRLRTGLNDT